VQAKIVAGADVTAATHGVERSKQVFEFAQKVKTDSDANKSTLLTFLFRDTTAGISTPEQINAAIKFINGAGGRSLLLPLPPLPAAVTTKTSTPSYYHRQPQWKCNAALYIYCSRAVRSMSYLTR